MKLVFTIVSRDDDTRIITKLTQNGFRVTKIASSGGFLKAGNTTFLCGMNEDKLPVFTDLIKQYCSKRTETTVSAPFAAENIGMAMAVPQTVIVGGATMFVLDVDQFLQV